MKAYKYKSGKKTQEFDTILDFKQTKEVSVILPTYNEEEGIKRMIDSIIETLNGRYQFEVIIVDDNSKDKTPEIIDSYDKDYVVALHRYQEKGIFSALQDGIKAARSNVVVIMDADFSHPPAKIIELLSYMNEADIVNCSRFAPGGGVEMPWFKRLATFSLNLFLRIILGFKVTDFTGGFHAMKRDKFLALPFKYKARWGEFDMELFYRAIRRGYTIKEIPFVYKYREEGHSKSQSYIYYAYLYWKRALQLRFFG
tara:strand:+ start:1124 stop:1888 length:765 start_codon:yes stop_codon:yes gene_type:complete